MRPCRIALPIVLLLALSNLFAQQEATTKPEEQVVYTTIRPYELEILLFERGTETGKRIAPDQANDYNPTFSPDGRWLVFCSERRANPDLFAVDLHSEGPPRQLTFSPAMEDAPAFSPDGKVLAFVSDRDGNADIFVMPFAPDDPAAEQRVVSLTHHPGGDFNPAFSPDAGRSCSQATATWSWTIHFPGVSSGDRPAVFLSAATST